MSIFLVSLLAALSTQDRRLATIPEGAEAGHFTFSADGNRVVYSLKEGDSFRLVDGDWKSGSSAIPVMGLLPATGPETFYALAVGKDLRFFERDMPLFPVSMAENASPWIPGRLGGKRVVTFVRDVKNETTSIVVDGKPGKPHKGHLRAVVISADGSVVAATLDTDDGSRVIVNDAAGPLLDDVTLPALSADGKVVAYGTEENGKYFLVQGEKRSPLAERPSGVILSADGVFLAYRVKVPRPGKSFLTQVVFGERRGPPVSFYEEAAISPDGKHIAYRAMSKEGVFRLVVDDQIMDVGDLHGGPSFVEGGRRVGFGVRKGNELWWKTLEVSK